ncbi:MAG TPA: glutamate synthase subunit beta [Gemmatimonadaceae bacterium]|nr:glutamate synthase subunit beta [Gemmatimonadaceae bacterium]
MGDPRGFITLRRATPVREPVPTRVRHWGEFYTPLAPEALADQGARCMDCGVPFCQGDTGCPVRNVIPEWNDLVHRGRWREASEALHATNNFPELTGRLCPAPCESACVLGLIDEPVAIRTIEQAIADRAFAEGWIAPRPPRHERPEHVVVVGSGPAGLAAAQQLRRGGYRVTVLEQADRIGGLLRYGIPDFKLEKAVLDRRLAQLVAEGVVFRTGVKLGRDVQLHELRARYDAVLLATGAQEARELRVPGRELRGVHVAMELLEQQNRRLAGDEIPLEEEITAHGKRVVIIGGGDTGSDCAGVCHRQGAVSVQQFELNAQPPQQRSATTPWPLWPMQLRSSHAHEEGCERDWNVATTELVGERGAVRRLRTVRVTTRRGADGHAVPTAIAGTERFIDAELVLLATGYAAPTDAAMLDASGVARDSRGMVATDDAHHTSLAHVFAAGDARRGASLIVWAIREGRDAAAAIDRHLAALATRRSAGAISDPTDSPVRDRPAPARARRSR